MFSKTNRLNDDILEQVIGGMGSGVDAEGGAIIKQLHCPVCCAEGETTEFEIIGNNPPKCINCENKKNDPLKAGLLKVERI
jgi:hypothetical protein